MHHVNDVLEISKFEAGKVVIAQVPFDLEQMLEELVAGQRSAAGARGNTLDCSWISEPVSMMLGDPVRLRQVLLNLIGNAIKFTRNGEITVEVETVPNETGETLEFRVIDTGIGIEPANLERIFADFETIDATYRRGAEGTGLGLGIARRVTEAMDGQIAVRSVKDEGSVFSIRLPLNRACVEAIEDHTAPAAVDSRQLSVLIVEDNQINRVVLRDMLLAAGHRVTEALDGAEGVKLAEMMELDIILTDISMPVMDGIEATHAIRNGGGRSATLPILAVTAHALPGEIAAFLAAGMNDVIGKPIQRAELLRKIALYAGACEKVPETTVKEPETCAAPATVQVAPPVDTPVDEARFGELMSDLGVDVAAQLLQRFINETEETFCAISADHRESVNDMVPRLHKIAGSAAVLGAARLHKRLGELEALGKQGAEERFRDGLGDLAPIWSATRARMQALVKQG